MAAAKRKNLVEDYLLPRVPRQIYSKNAKEIRDVLRQVAELDSKDRSNVKLAISRVRTLLQALNEFEFVRICDELEANNWKPLPRAKK